MDLQIDKKSKFSNALSLYFEEFKTNQLTIKQKLRKEYESLVGESEMPAIKVFKVDYLENSTQK